MAAEAIVHTMDRVSKAALHSSPNTSDSPVFPHTSNRTPDRANISGFPSVAVATLLEKTESCTVNPPASTKIAAPSKALFPSKVDVRKDAVPLPT